ncbi:serine hydrolase domain-containing protein [Candidatus Omnitrophota bacterium]
MAKKMTKKIGKKSLVIIILLAALIAVAAALFYIKMHPKFDQKTQKELGQFLTESRERYKAPGLMIGIWSPQGNWLGTVGVSDIETNAPMDPFQRTRIGSITKTFTGTVVLQLVEEGKITLTDTLDKYRPYIPDSDKITIEQLLNMTSGLYNDLDVDWVGRAIFADPFKDWTPRELVKAAIEEKPYFAPGEGFHYSNTNTMILGMIIEQTTGNSVGEEIETRIIKRMDLKNTFYPTGDTIPGKHVHGYSDMEKKSELTEWTNQNPSWAGAAGAMISDIHDLKAYAKGLTDGSLLGKEMQEKRLTVWVDCKKKGLENAKYGLAVFSVDGFIGHNGELPGYITGMFYNPQKDATIIIIANIYPRDKAILEIFNGLVKLLWPKG